MKENKINSENYEAFYLDYLEGNLQEDDVLDLFSFLNENPDLKVDNEWPLLESNAVSLDVDFKNLLKADVLSEAISLNNIEFFLVAQKENQLNAQQLALLDQFLQKHPAYRVDQKLYQLSTLQADTSLVYPEKSGLKQRATIVLWPYFSAVAAACAILLFWLLPNSTQNLEVNSVARGLDPSVKELPRHQWAKKEERTEQSDNSIDRNSPLPKEKRMQWVPNLELKNTTPTPENVAENEKINKKSDNPIKLKIIDEQKLENAVANVITPNKKETNEGEGITAMVPNYGLSLKEVAPPVTKKLSDIINTEVKVKKGENASGERKGVLIKLGNFEFYRNKKVKP